MSDDMNTNNENTGKPELELKKKRTAVSTITTIVLLLICIALAGTVIFNMLSNQDRRLGISNADDEVEPSVNVSVMTTSYGPFVNATSFNGEIITDGGDAVSISPDTSGTVTQVLVKKGDVVSEGQIIAYVDPSTPGANYKLSPVKSTINGQVESVSVSKGMSVTSATTVAQVAPTDPDLKITIQVAERYLGTLALGTEATFTSVAYPDKTFTATVSYISSTVSTSSRTATVELDVTGDSSGLKSGMYVRLALPTETIESTLVVPTSAVSTYAGNQVVFVIESDGRASRRQVTTGTSNAADTVIYTGLTAGETVVTAGNVTDGILVNIL